MKDHAIFIGKIALGCAIAIVLVNYLQKQMAAKSTKMMVVPTPAPAATEVAAPTV